MDESFLPYAMIEPLLTPGMTGDQMTRLILGRLGLDYRQYTLVALEADASLPLTEIVKQGLHVMRDAESTRRGARRRGHEPVR